MKASDRNKLRERIRTLEGLTDDERSQLLGLLNESKTYGLVWEDKPEKVEEQLRQQLPILREVREKAIVRGGKTLIDSGLLDAPNHIIIEGDNLVSLTTLAYTHAGKIDVIYIDPPYNTGNKDFVYNDDYVDRDDAYRHSKWLSFMAKRLKIAKKLLSDRGVIFISIDDNEQANLKLLCDEIFGRKNLLANLIWKSKSGGANDSRYFAVDHEYILVYGFRPDAIKPFMDNKADVTTHYNQRDEKGEYSLDRLDKQSIRYSESLDYEIIGPDGKAYKPRHKDPLHPNATWRWGKTTVQERYGELVFLKGNVYTKNYKKESNIARSILYEDRFGRTRTGKTELAAIFQNVKFTAPKPSKLIWHLLNISDSTNSTVLDFFAGSGTTLHAVMQLNAEDGGKRQCILCTNNENGICENVTYERNKRVIQGYTKPNGEKVEGLHRNNLRYYRTEFISRSRSLRNMQKLVNLSTDMLCIKENLYTEQHTFGTVKTHPQIFRYFTDGDRQMLIIYREEYIEEIVGIIAGVEVKSPIKVYVFSPSEDPASDLFEPVADKVEPTALPAAIYNTYKRILPRQRDKVIAVPENLAVGEDTGLGGLFNTEGGEA